MTHSHDMKVFKSQSPLLRYGSVLLLLLASYVAFAFLSCLTSGGAVRHHVARSVARGDLQSDYPNAFFPAKQTQMDNFTDALIVMQAYCLSRDSIVQSAMLLPRLSYGAAPQTTCLQQAMQDVPGNIVTYPRYWHGSTFLTRCLLAFFSYQDIRLLLYLVSSLLLAWLLVRLWKVDGWVPAVAVTASFALMYGFVIQLSIQFFPVLALSLIGSLLACKYVRQPGKMAMTLFVIGSLTAYFDLLTTPLLTLGLPLALYCYLGGRASLSTAPAVSVAAAGGGAVLSSGAQEEPPFGKALARLAGMGLLWAVGYGVTWFCKWLIATLLTPANVFKDAFSQASERTGDYAENVWELADFSRWTAITSNAGLMPYKFLLLAAVALLVLAALRFNRKGWKTSLLLFGVALLPYAWYFVLANHSYLHWWFTFRTQLVTMVALLLSLANLVDWPRLRPKCKREMRA